MFNFSNLWRFRTQARHPFLLKALQDGDAEYFHQNVTAPLPFLMNKALD